MKVSDWIVQYPSPPVTVAPKTPMPEIAKRFLSYPKLRDLYVISSEGIILGHVRHRRLAQIMLAEHLPIQNRSQILERISIGPANEIMEGDFVTARLNEELDNVLNRMLEYQVEDMPVLNEENKFAGSINLTDVLGATLEIGIESLNGHSLTH